ncbi:alg9-like mannosyltransferase family domain-containing protein [Hirsutella rhossiliensis]|uniref:Mannosyltransferase n=1 Tax=Hirsutella rhossiliensis TaxID=111463 RepID=A0A9P8MLF0_9HYPO|nr:alg9-like mannosyltransferase family domain-containing protein [Hirsutella rhossiliensis]KAH0957383.1 alg9-like mannosyltransferase family domain-containing protein [Hirsutella rhossiliensis]
MAPSGLLLDSLLLAAPLVHLAASPHTKVEESFNLQAAHDVLVYGVPLAAPARLARAFDHFAFPGAVPRSLVGPVVLAAVARPAVALVGFRHAQLVVRAVLAACNAAALVVFRRALAEAFGAAVAAWWVLMTVAQFHVVYYASRTLPNMFAFGLTTLALAFLLPKTDPRRARVRRRQAIGLLVFATAIFRAELAILLAAVGLQLLASRQLALRSLVALVVGTLAVALAISVPLDSYLWQRPLWPELAAFYFNAVQGAASDWGVSPWHYYFSSALPRLLLNPLAVPLVLFALAHPGTRRQARLLAVPSLLFVAIYSLQPHKEARFVFYAVPPLTAAAALGANLVASRRAKSPAYALAALALALALVASCAASAAVLLVSSLNYPGGDALAQLNALVARSHDASAPTLAVHADVLTCMTGLTLFGQNPHGLPLALARPSALADLLPPPAAAAASGPVFLFDKTEDSPLLDRLSFWETMDYALMEDPAAALGSWHVVGVVHGYDGIEVLKPGAAPRHHDAGPVVGRGARVARLRDAVRGYTGGWWVGPRMSPRIHIMKRTRHTRHAVS